MKPKFATILTAILLTATAGAQEKLFSVNLYAYGRNLADEWQQESWRETVRIEATDADPSAGYWNTTAWTNIQSGAGSTPILADDGATEATFTLINQRNAGPWNWATFRDDTDSVDVGNATLLDGHANGTSRDSEDFPTKICHFEVTDIPFPLYDVVLYVGANGAQYLGGGYQVRVNGEIPADEEVKTGGWGLTLPSGEPTGALVEATEDGGTGNCIVFTAQTGSTFEGQVFGTTDDGFAHIGLAGIQIRENLAVIGGTDPATSGVSASPAAVQANGLFTSTITVTCKDANDLPVGGASVSLAATSGPGTPTIDPPSATTDGGGVATFTVSSTTGGIVEFTATDTTGTPVVIAETASVEFLVAGPVDADQSSVVAVPPAVYADGASTSTITVTLRDADGLLNEGETVALAGSASASISPPSATTDVNGEVSFTVSSSVPGPETFTATKTSGGNLVITETAEVNFVDPDAFQTIHVNFYASSGPSANWITADEGTLQGPAGGLGESWNQFNTTTGGNLLAASGVETGVGFTNNVDSGWLRSTSEEVFSVFWAGREHFGKGADTTHTINGLTPGDYYHVYVISNIYNTADAEAGSGEWTTANPTTTIGAQPINNFELVGDSWVPGNNYALFEYVEVDVNGEITVLGDASDADELEPGSPAYRLGLNGIQLVQTTAPLARILTFGVAGSEGVIDAEAGTISLEVPFGTDLATLAPEFTLTSGTCDQISGAVPSPNFAAAPGNTVNYVVTDDTTDPVTVNTYEVTVTVAPAIGMLVIDLGSYPPATVIEGGATIASGPTNLPLTLPPGSILRGIDVDVTLEASDNGSSLNYANDLTLLFDPTPGTPGDDVSVGIVSAAANVDFGIVEELNWAGGNGGPDTSLTESKTDADWTGDIDLGLVGLLLGNAYQDGAWVAGQGGTWSGTITLTYDVAAGGSAYDTWSGGAPFEGDKNGDGVRNGLAFLLGAANPDADALGLLPTVQETGGGLVLSFSVRNAATRGTASASVQWTSDLGTTDPWAGAVLPDSTSEVNGVDFQVTPNGDLNDVVATIPSTEAADGRLFGRVEGAEN